MLMLNISFRHAAAITLFIIFIYSIDAFFIDYAFAGLFSPLRLFATPHYADMPDVSLSLRWSSLFRRLLAILLPLLRFSRRFIVISFSCQLITLLR